MIDPKNLMVPGAYHTMTFRVIPEKDTFTIEILQAVRKTGDLIDPAETDKFELIGLVLAAEKDHITLVSEWSTELSQVTETFSKRMRAGELWAT